MKKQDFQRTIEEYVRREPFHPFTIELSTGEQIVVRDPKSLMCQGGAAAYVPADGDLTLFDYHAVREVEIAGQSSR